MTAPPRDMQMGARDSVYAIQRGQPVGGMVAVKIGRSRNPGRRRSGLQTASPDRLKLIAAASISDADRAERALHDALAPFRISGEWFHLPAVALVPELFRTIERTNGGLDAFSLLCIQHAAAGGAARDAAWEDLKQADLARARSYDVLAARVDDHVWMRPR